MSFIMGFSDSWDILMTLGITEQSKRNCMVRASSTSHRAWNRGRR